MSVQVLASCTRSFRSSFSLTASSFYYHYPTIALSITTLLLPYSFTDSYNCYSHLIPPCNAFSVFHLLPNSLSLTTLLYPPHLSWRLFHLLLLLTYLIASPILTQTFSCQPPHLSPLLPIIAAAWVPFLTNPDCVFIVYCFVLTSSSRPGRPPKRASDFMTMSPSQESLFDLKKRHMENPGFPNGHMPGESLVYGHCFALLDLRYIPVQCNRIENRSLISYCDCYSKGNFYFHLSGVG